MLILGMLEQSIFLYNIYIDYIVNIDSHAVSLVVFSPKWQTKCADRAKYTITPKVKIPTVVK
jgi:hypothetical protein